MKINISAKNMELTNDLSYFVEEKIGSLNKLVAGIEPVSAKVEIGKPSRHHRTGMVFYAEVNLKLRGDLLRAQASHMDLRTAIIEAKDELQLQIKKYKEKNTQKYRQSKK